MDNSKKMAQVMAEIEERDRDGLPIRELCVEAIGYLEEARKEFLRRAQEAGYELTTPRVGEIEVQQYSAMRQLAERAGLPHDYNRLIRDVRVRIFGEEAVRENFDRWGY